MCQKIESQHFYSCLSKGKTFPMKREISHSTQVAFFWKFVPSFLHKKENIYDLDIIMANPFISESTGIRFLEVTIAVIFFLYKKFVESFSSLIIV